MTTGQPTAGYSGTPLHRKLGIKPGHLVLVSHLPDGATPPGVPRFDPARLDPDRSATVHRRPATPADGYDVVLVFCADSAALRQRLPSAMERTATAGRCWVAWPKQASGVPTDLTENVVRDAALEVGWVDVKVCAIDAIWSGLCLVRRLENRAPGKKGARKS